MANLEANVSMNRCQHVSKNQNKSSDQSSVLDTQVFRSYSLPHADPYNPKSTTRSDLLERGHGKRKHSLASRLPRSKMQGMASLCLWLPCHTCCFLFIIHCVAMSMRHNCGCSSTAVGVLSTSRLSTLWRLNLRKWVSSMGKAQDGNLEWLLPEKVKGETINRTPSGCNRPS